MKNILFVCKHNVFRSKVAEAYFKKINKNKNLNAFSSGVIKGDFLNENQQKAVDLEKATAKKLGINIKSKLTGLSISLLKKQDLIIIVADDIPKIIFNNKAYVKKVICWKIGDYKVCEEEHIRNIIKKIMKKVDKLVNELK